MCSWASPSTVGGIPWTERADASLRGRTVEVWVKVVKRTQFRLYNKTQRFQHTDPYLWRLQKWPRSAVLFLFLFFFSWLVNVATRWRHCMQYLEQNLGSGPAAKPQTGRELPLGYPVTIESLNLTTEQNNILKVSLILTSFLVTCQSYSFLFFTSRIL